MFKLESYITPILLSYVNKYIKNLSPEDIQVSLWGGDASFQNLDLRLDVLEQELQLPFSILSGHIHELILRVPWTKLASEPINITINTIELVLKLQDPEHVPEVSKEPKRKTKKPDIVAPPGYVQSLINKIVNNITINCNNLILKYIEEDIVVSVNIKLLTFQSADEKWKAAYTNLSFTQLIMRKLITLSDLTVCIDKRNAAGKIEVYQEPILYRCFIEMRLYKKFRKTFTEKAITTRLDVHCVRMEFSLTEQQIPMLMRIINLLLALHHGLLKKEIHSEANLAAAAAAVQEEEVGSTTESWTGWAWNIATGILPFPLETEAVWSNTDIDLRTYSDFTFQFGIYIDHVIFSLKISESYTNNKGYNSQRKLKYNPVLCLQLNGCYTDTVLAGIEWCSVQTGIAEVQLNPKGCCTCGVNDVIDDDTQIQHYLKTGSYEGHHTLDSLFDKNKNDKTSKRKVFKLSWNHYVNTITEASMLEKTPAFAVDYLYQLEVPEDLTSEKLSELGSDLEYSNLVEKGLCRLVAGPLEILVCSGLVHRLSTIQQVTKNYDYAPYITLPPAPELSELHPPSMDDFDALNDSIPKRVTRVTFFKTVIAFQLLDHPKFTPTSDVLMRRPKKLSIHASTTNLPMLTCPKVSLECGTFDVKIVLPMYPKRLVYTTAQLPDPPIHMFEACYMNANINITEISSHMIYSAIKRTTILLPFNICVHYKSVLLPKYWINPDIPHEDITAEIDSITLTGTKAKWMVFAYIMEKFSVLDPGEFKSSIFTSSLLQDAFKDSGMVVLELYAEKIKWHKLNTVSTIAHSISLDSLKAFILEPYEEYIDLHMNEPSYKEPNQVLIISGPESNDGSNANIAEEPTLFTLTVQYPISPEKQVHASILYFNLGEMKICFDPLLFRWFLYYPKVTNIKYDGHRYQGQVESIASTSRPRTISEGTSNQKDVPRSTLHESVHSSSEKEHNIQRTKSKKIEQEPQVKNAYEDILRWYQVWTNVIIIGDISHVTVYFPSHSLSAVGSQGIEDAIKISCAKDPSPDIIVVKLPTCNIRSAVQRQFVNYISSLPIKLPEQMWQTNKQSLPWSIKVENFCCYTLQNKHKLCFLKPLSGNATIGLSVKYKNEVSSEPDPKQQVSDTKITKKSSKTVVSKTSISIVEEMAESVDNISSFSVCVHIDNTPIVVALSEIQVLLITSVMHGLLEILSLLQPKSNPVQVNVGPSTIGKLQNDSTLFYKDGFLDVLSEKTPTSPHIEVRSNDEDSNSIKLTFWVQWTITRLRIKLYGYEKTPMKNMFAPSMSPTLKLVFDMEDIMSSLDLQQVYMKFKSKIVTASIEHFRRDPGIDEWERGLYLGSIMLVRDELSTSERQDDFDFMSLTITTARCGHVHNKWGAKKKHRLSEMQIDQNADEKSSTRNISEVVATLQPIDFIISPHTLKNFFLVLEPFLRMPSISDSKPKPQSSTLTCINNANLPLAYLDCNGLRFILISQNLNEKLNNHDVCIIEIGSINLMPTAENPICRTPVRPDIYQQAAQSRILNVPGSEIEDRQYQLNINSLSINTACWVEFSQLLQRNINPVSALYTMNENPALEWNNLGLGKATLAPQLKLTPILEKFNLGIVLAPAITYQYLLVTGCSIEINFVSDIDINLNLQQIRLLSALLAEFGEFSNPVNTEFINKYKFTYLKHVEQNSEDAIFHIDQRILDYTRDSGVEITDANSEATVKTKVTFSRSSSLERDRRHDIKPSFDTKSSDLSQSKFTNSSMPSEQNAFNHCPLEILLTGGHIQLSVYKIIKKESVATKLAHKTHNKVRKKNNTDEVKNKTQNTENIVSQILKEELIDKNLFKSTRSEEDLEYDASEEDSFEEVAVKESKILPLFFVYLSQPNIFYSHLAFEKKVNISCFDINFKTCGNRTCYTTGIPTQKHYSINLLNTKAGIPNQDTGIPPAFLTLKWVNSVGKHPSLDINFGRPIKLIYSHTLFDHILFIKKQIFHNVDDFLMHLIQSNSIESDIMPTLDRNTYSCNKFNSWRNKCCGIDTFNLKLSQIMFAFQTVDKIELVVSFDNLGTSLTFSTRPERITDVLHLKNFTLSVVNNGVSKLLLNPWSCNFEACIFWEAWQYPNSDPQIQMSVDSDAFILNISAEEINCLNAVLIECNDLMSTLHTKDDENETIYEEANNDLRDQYYKDDLRAGAFQFIDASGSANELPLPYQVMFWNKPVVAMAWRYPQPRILTKVRVFPVPFKVNQENDNTQAVLCYLEYWSDCHNCYKSYTKFQLSESEVYHLELPKSVPQIAVSCTWRVVLKSSGNKLNKSFVLARALAACMRIDSYFNSSLVPKIQSTIKLSIFGINVYNQLKTNVAMVMPEKLNHYTPDGLMPDTQCFVVIEINNPNLFCASWDCGIHAIEFAASGKCSVLDYSSLTLQSFIDPFPFSLTLNLAECVNLSMLFDTINIRLNAAISHTFAISTQLWTKSIQEHNVTGPSEMVIVTRYVICNNTNLKLRFGQVDTDEDILLPSRFLHLYCWRSQKHCRMLKIASEQNGWVWSVPFTIENDKCGAIELLSAFPYTLFLTVKSLSSTQKQIIISGQLVICNMLLDHFELKVIPVTTENKDKEFKNAKTHVVSGRNTTPSLIVNLNQKLVLRLRFFNLESAWSGDIPLEENLKSAQPWLVKIPLQERGQFLSIWCRVIIQNLNGYQKLLVMLWPLFMIRSNLPISTDVHVETPSLNINLDSTVSGRGEIQQLYCPGTINHSHQLAFKLDAEYPGSDSFVPLNYDLIDHNIFFKKTEVEDIDTILESLKNFDKTTWPYIDYNLEAIDWIANEQPFTEVQIRYQNTCQYASALLVELLPWCICLNTLGCEISVNVEKKNVCIVKHHGIVTPTKLEDTFTISVNFEDEWFKSPLLQLARNEWSQSFYMPKIKGSIPPDGSIKINVDCSDWICMVSITSAILNEMRILHIASCYVVVNYTKFNLEIACLALRDQSSIYSIPVDLMGFRLSVAPNLENSNVGTPITKWYTMNEKPDASYEYSLHIVVTLNNQLVRSCPIRVDNGLTRKSISLYSDSDNIPLVLIAQEHKNEIYLSLHHDYNPQILIKNKCSVKLFCAECTDQEEPVVENAHFDWICYVQPNSEKCYTMPYVAEKFPSVDEIPAKNLIIAIDPIDKKNGIPWSKPINIYNFTEQYINLPEYGDVKLTIKKISYTLLIVVDSVTKVEIFAQDVRSRLLLQSSQSHDTVSSKLSLSQSKSSSDACEYPNTNLAQHYSTSLMSCLSSTDEYSSSTKTLSTQFNKQTLWPDLNMKALSIKTALKEYCLPNKKDWNILKLAVYVKNIIFTLTVDNEENFFEQIDATTWSCDNVAITLTQNERIDCCITSTNIQLDNQLFSRGCYDFPVILTGENALTSTEINFVNKQVIDLIEAARENNLLTVNLLVDTWIDKVTLKKITGIQNIKIEIGPLLAYIEDTYIAKIMEYINVLEPTQLVMWTLKKKPNNLIINTNMVEIPEHLLWEANIIARPLNLNNLSIEPFSVSLTVHASVKIYIALDRSPLQFSKFERKNVTTTSYRLGHTLTRHYISGAIFGAGWVVGSLEMLGSPGGLARSVGTGLRDFISLPYYGFIQGPWAFLVGITHGSTSLMRHITAGTVDSLTKFAASVARNADRMTMDKEHQRRTELQRRQKPQGVAQGFMQGLTGLGISLLGAVGGIAHHSLQSVMNQEATPRSIVTGVALGLVGVITKPLSGAAELVALTGQGLLQGAGWNLLPVPRINSNTNRARITHNSILKYKWKFLQNITLHSNLYADIDAIYESNQVALILTYEALVIYNIDEDVIQRTISLNEINCVEDVDDPTLLRITLVAPESRTQNNEPGDVEMDPVARARITDYVKNSAGLVPVLESASDQSEFDISPIPSRASSPKRNAVVPSLLTIMVNPQNKNYFCNMLSFLKHQNQDNVFKIV